MFVDGRPDKNLYRHYRIRTVGQSDDFAMMREVLTRRFGRALREDPERDDDLQDAAMKALHAGLLTVDRETSFVPLLPRPLSLNGSPMELSACS